MIRRESIPQPHKKLWEALKRGAPFARITREQLEAFAFALSTARDDRGMPNCIDYELTRLEDGTIYLTADVVLCVRPDGWPGDAT